MSKPVIPLRSQHWCAVLFLTSALLVSPLGRIQAENFSTNTTLEVQQQGTVKGTVVDAKGDPLIGVTVVVVGTQIGTATDIDGNFTLMNVAQDATLKISYVGYIDQEVKVAGRPVIKVVLSEDAEQLEEVVVIGYGAVKKTNVTGAISQMDSKGIDDRPLARAETALQGQLAGVTVRTTSGEPGTGMQIRVRGAASINASSDPLYVVDGAPVGDLTGLNPADIANIEVLKDAASAAIYGSRGNNGVVIVTTKSGKAGKPTISFNATYGVQSLEKKLDIMSAEEWMAFNIKYIDAGYLAKARTNGHADASIADDVNKRLAYAGSQHTASTFPTWSDTEVKYIPDPRWFKYVPGSATGHNIAIDGIDPNQALSILDWQDEFYRNAPVSQIDVNVSGGTDNTKYMFSGGIFDQQGIATGNGYKRYALRANIESKFNKYLAAGLSLAPTYTRSNGQDANGKDKPGHIVLSSAPVSEPGVGYWTNVDPNPKYLWAESRQSPLAIMETNINKNNTVRMQGNAFLRITPIDGLKVELLGSVNYSDNDYYQYLFSSVNANWAQGEGANSSGRHGTSRSWRTLIQSVANYDKTFGKHTIGLMLGASQEQSGLASYSTNQSFGKPFPNDAITGSFDESTLAVTDSNVGQSTPVRMVSFFGRAMYNFEERYMGTVSLRRDGSSVFGVNNKWGYFPAASVGWVASKEKFFTNLGWDWWNMLKLRASYGVTGNNGISSSAAYPTLRGGTYGGMAGYNASGLGNLDLGWEKSHSTDFAIDFGFLNNRIQLSLDYYVKNTYDLLYSMPSVGAAGFTSTMGNIGEIHNQGFELELNTTNIRTRDFTWSTSFNLSYNKNEVKAIGVDNTPIQSGFQASSPSNIITVGHAINEFYMYEAIGVWKTQAEIDAYAAAHNGVNTFEGKPIFPGDLRYKDVNNDGAIDKANDFVFLGLPNAPFTYGLTNRLRYKNFDMSMLITAQTGGMIFGALGRAIDRPSMNPTSNMMDVWNHAWWSEEEQGDGKTPYVLSTTTGGTVDSRWLQSSDYLRIKNLTIGYKIPVPNRYIKNARVYLSVENLLLFDKFYNGFSPEANQYSTLGIDYGGYPTSRVFTLGFNLTF